jgi:hypothetical protein
MGAEPLPGNLLEPTLNARPEPAALLSERASFVVSFFGGPIAALLAGAFNVRALKRVRTDAWLLVLAGVASVAVVLLAANATLEADARALETERAGTAAPAERRQAGPVVLFGHEVSRPLLRRIVQASGLLVFLGFFLRHRRFHRALALVDVAPARPWVVGLSCVGLGWFLQFSIGFIYAGMRS